MRVIKMKRIENSIHGIKCAKCGKVLLYGSIIYYDGKTRDSYCLKCGKDYQG